MRFKQLRHFTIDAPMKFEARTYGHDWHHTKPHGFWVSIEDGDYGDMGWLRWTRDNKYLVPNYAHNVTIMRNAKLAMITNVEERDAFTERYGEWRVKYDYDGVVVTAWTNSMRDWEYCWRSWELTPRAYGTHPF